jgi:electron-transferring-flavoprotein dehydrogenase
MNPIDVLIVGGGPAGLATAIRLKQRIKKDISVVVIDKASHSGRHTLSGAVFEAACLDELLPGWRDDHGFVGAAFFPGMPTVERDEMYFLTSRSAHRIPPFLVPSGMHHKGDHLISLSSFTEALAKAAEKAGVEVYASLSAESLRWDRKAVRGVKLVDTGLGPDRKPKSNFIEGEKIDARVTVLADGPRGVLSREYASVVGGNENPQVYSVGIKQIFQLPQRNNFGSHRAVHTLGFPNRPDVFGGGFFYSMGCDYLAAGIILGLDWKYTDLNPQAEFEYLKTHPFVAQFLDGAKLVATGAKTIPEGGFYALPRLWTDGALVVGDAAGFVNMTKIKGVHYAILSGMAAADAIADALVRGDRSSDAFSSYAMNLETRGILKDMRHARNFRQAFQWGVPVGMPLSQVQHLLPFRLGMGQDHARTKKGARLERRFAPVVDRAAFASLSGTLHREDEPSHLLISDPNLCDQCEKAFGSPCTIFCPTEVYRRRDEAIRMTASNCVHCGTCAVKCPFQNIVWTPPEGGEGPQYKMM